MYRMQVYDAQTTGMHWQRQKVAAEHFPRSTARCGCSERYRRCRGGSRSAMAEIGGGSTRSAAAVGGMPQVAVGNLKDGTT